MTNMELTDREIALIYTMRRMRNGVLEKVGVTNGEPGVIVATTQRIDFQRADELERALAGGHVPLPMVISQPTDIQAKPGGLPWLTTSEKDTADATSDEE